MDNPRSKYKNSGGWSIRFTIAEGYFATFVMFHIPFPGFMQLQLGGFTFDKTQWMSSKPRQSFPSAHNLARAARCEFPQ